MLTIFFQHKNTNDDKLTEETVEEQEKTIIF